MALEKYIERITSNQIDNAGYVASILQDNSEYGISTADLLDALAVAGLLLTPITVDHMVICDEDGNRIAATSLAYFAHLEILKNESK
jgi:hypothetical protein